MARMIPPEPIENNSWGEKKVFEALKHLSDKYTVLHSLSWYRRQDSFGGKEWGEADFTIIHRTRGILVVEVKSGVISQKDGEWYQQFYRGDETKKLKKDSMKQASDSVYRFVDLLKEHNITKVSPSGKLLRYRIEPVVWFPSMDGLGEDGSLPPAYKPFMVLTGKELELNAAKLDERIQSIYDEYKTFGIREYPNPVFDEAYQRRVVDFLVPEICGKQTALSKMEEQKDEFDRMTKLQSDIILGALKEQKFALISGGAGTELKVEIRGKNNG